MPSRLVTDHRVVVAGDPEEQVCRRPASVPRGSAPRRTKPLTTWSASSRSDDSRTCRSVCGQIGNRERAVARLRAVVRCRASDPESWTPVQAVACFSVRRETVDVSVGRATANRIAVNQPRREPVGSGRRATPRDRGAEVGGAPSGAVIRANTRPNRQAAFDPPREMPRSQELGDLAVMGCEPPDAGGGGLGETVWCRARPAPASHQPAPSRPAPGSRRPTPKRRANTRPARRAVASRRVRRPRPRQQKGLAGPSPRPGVPQLRSPAMRRQAVLERLAAALRASRARQRTPSMRISMPCGFRSHPDRPFSRADFRKRRASASPRFASSRYSMSGSPSGSSRSTVTVSLGDTTRRRSRSLPSQSAARHESRNRGRPSASSRSSNLVQRGPRVAASLTGPRRVRQRRASYPDHCVARVSAKREEIAGRKEQRVVGPQRLGLPSELAGLARSRISQKHEHSPRRGRRRAAGRGLRRPR